MTPDNPQPSNFELDGNGILKPSDAKRRRDMLQWAIQGGVMTLTLEVVQAIGTPRVQMEYKSQATQEQEATTAIENGGKLEPWYFAKDMRDASVRIVNFNSTLNTAEMLAGAFTGTAIGGYLLNYHPAIVNRFIGVASMATGRTLDIISTAMAAIEIADPRFTEYRLGPYFFEQSPTLSAHPSVIDLLTQNSLISIILLGSGFAAPTLGRFYLGISPALFENNHEVAKVVGIALQLGDEVKKMIQAGKKPDEIKDFLLHAELKKTEVPQQNPDSDSN